MVHHLLSAPSLSVVLACCCGTLLGGGGARHVSAQGYKHAARLRSFKSNMLETASVVGDYAPPPGTSSGDGSSLQELLSEQDRIDAAMDLQQAEYDALMGAFKSSNAALDLSMPFPSDRPSDVPSTVPTKTPPPPSARPTSAPTLRPTTRSPSATERPSNRPSVSTMPSLRPSAHPTVSSAPSTEPSVAITERPSHAPTISSMPSLSPTVLASQAPSPNPTRGPTASPTADPTASPTANPTASPSSNPTLVASSSPSVGDTAAPTIAPSAEPSMACNMTEASRAAGILAILDAVANPVSIRDNFQPQGQATSWLIDFDERRLCPDDPKMLQRWVLAVIYFSTGGNRWFQCSDNSIAQDACGEEEPFVGDSRFLSEVHECLWAGIECVDLCVTEIEFEENNLVGTIPTEIGLLSDLVIWGMERGGLRGQIPTEIARLSNLIFLDLDFNRLTGTLSPELLSVSTLEQLDINNNLMSGSINGIGVYPQMEFLQLHDNFFTGTVPAEVGTFTNLAAFTLHETAVSGTMPQEVCDLLSTAGNGGDLRSLIADCNTLTPNIVCPCCTDCRDP